MSAYYNEYEPFAAEWLRNLIKQGLIADGEVDGRSIVDIHPSDLRGFDQCHFFAGIGVWSYALRLAGWPDDQPVWTGSCPCQPFSAAGKGKGFDDERHLWPVFHRLIAECRPAVVFGEQVASKDGLQWLDAVCADMEASGYAIGAADMCAAGVGAPHIRQRLWFVGERLGDTGGSRLERQRHGHQAKGGWIGAAGSVAEAGELSGLADAMRGGTGNDTGEGVGAEAAAHCKDGGVPGERLRSGIKGSFCGLANAELHEQRRWGRPGSEGEAGDEPWLEPGRCGEAVGLADAAGVGSERNAGTGRAAQRRAQHHRGDDRPSPTNGFWHYADWLHCRDGKWRPVEPGTFPLANGAPSRVGRLRAYGNAIVPQVAAEVISAFMEARP